MVNERAKKNWSTHFRSNLYIKTIKARQNNKCYSGKKVSDKKIFIIEIKNLHSFYIGRIDWTKRKTNFFVYMSKRKKNRITWRRWTTAVEPFYTWKNVYRLFPACFNPYRTLDEVKLLPIDLSYIRRQQHQEMEYMKQHYYYFFAAIVLSSYDVARWKVTCKCYMKISKQSLTIWRLAI